MTEEELAKNWHDHHKTDVMLRICHDLVNGDLNGFTMPQHIQTILNSIQEDPDAD